jgi:hypothetical protein
MFCTKVKEYLSREHVSFEDRDITLDPSAISELQKLGFMTTPHDGSGCFPYERNFRVFPEPKREPKGDQ